MTIPFTPSHQIVHNGKTLLVEAIDNGLEFCTYEDYKSFFPGPCGLGSYGIDETDLKTILVRSDYDDPQFGKCVGWRPAPGKIVIYPLCPRCGSDLCVKNGSNKSGTQQYLCRKCDRSFTCRGKLMGGTRR